MMTSEPTPSPHGGHRADTYPDLAGKVADDLGPVGILAAFAGGNGMPAPTDVAAATLFLASSASSWITCVTLDIADGRIML